MSEKLLRDVPRCLLQEAQHQRRMNEAATTAIHLVYRGLMFSLGQTGGYFNELGYCSSNAEGISSLQLMRGLLEQIDKTPVSLLSLCRPILCLLQQSLLRRLRQHYVL